MLGIRVLVSQKTAVVEVFRKDGERWSYQSLQDDDAILTLESVGCELSFEEIFLNVKFPPEEPLPVPPGIPR